MGQDSKIEWTHHTLNLWWGCTEVHAGCDNCYASTLSNRWGNDLWGNDKPRKLIKKAFSDLLKFQKLAEASGEVHRVFVGSMMDIFEKPMPVVDAHGLPVTFGDDDDEQKTTGMIRDEFFERITRGDFPNLMFLLLTKRPSNINKYIPESWKENSPANIMFGTSPVDQKTAEKLIPQLLRVNGKRFLSIEPMLSGFDIDHIDADMGGDKHWCWINPLDGRQTDMGRPCEDVPTIDWVICGGESGHSRRPFDPDWGRKLRDQCAKYGVPFFFKQIDKVLPIPEDLMIRQFPVNG